MFRLYHSNDLEVLKELLLREIRQNPPGVFDHEQILVQSQGMAHWLKLQLADGLGVAAQVDFPLPSAYVWKVFNTLKPELPERSHFEKQAMAWKLMRLLPELASQSDAECAAIATYLNDDTHGLKLYELAHEIADVFDQYLVYRPDWLLAWERGENDIADTDVSAHPWQPIVWRALVADSQRLNHSLDHRARLTLSLEQLVTQYGDRLSELPERLFVFGIAALPGGYWDVLNAISERIDVHFFLLNPCRNYWGDIVDDRQRARILKQSPDAAEYLDRGNPVLASWGRLGRDFLTLVHETAAEGRLQDIEAYADVLNSDAPTLLQRIQADLLDLNDPQAQAYTPAALKHSKFKQSIANSDDSLRVVAAHSPLREVQRLHDQLLHWFTHNPELKPRDVVVMVPDIDQYAPYIDAVFASAPEKQRIPWAIADQSQVQENPLLDSVLGLLSLCDSRLQLTDVLDWLDVEAIRARFNIAEADLDIIRDWLERAGVRWGLDDEHRKALGFPGFSQNSWRKGLRQLLLGMMLPDSDDMHWQDDWPVFGVEGNASELLGNLLSLIDTLVKWQSYLSESHATSEWMSAIPELIDDMYAPDLDAGVQLQRVRDAVMRWQEQLSDADYSADLSPQVVRSWFNENLAQQGGWQRFLAGPVNFCTLMPMRSIPFKAVCLLGMNDQDYPRPVTPVGFDLMVTGKARRGDRSRREDDRYLVLEALCSAQHYFYISYRGRDARENHELQPSVLINELLDYVGDAYCLEGDEKYPAKQSRENLRQWLIEELPLQPFNRRTFSKEKNGMPQEAGTGIVSFHKLWSSVTNAEFSDSTILPFYESPLALPEEFSLNHVLWSDVKDALLKPADFFLRRRLRLSPELYFKDSNNEETFAPNNLENAILRTQWVEDQITSSAQTTHGFTAREQALGHLPVNGLGILQSESFSRELDELVERLQGLCAQPLNNTEKDDTSLTITRDVILNSGEVVHCQVSGELTHCYQRQLVHWRAGELRGQHLLDAWLDLVLVAAAQPERIASAIVIGRDKTKGRLQEFEFNAPSQIEALAYIDHCIQYYRDAWQAPQPVMPGIMWALSQAADDKKEKLILAAAENEFSEFNRTAMQLCRPELAQQLLSTDVADGDANAYDHWLEQYQWLWALPQACLVGDDE